MNKDEASFGIPSEPCLGEVWGGWGENVLMLLMSLFPS